MKDLQNLEDLANFSNIPIDNIMSIISNKNLYIEKLRLYKKSGGVRVVRFTKDGNYSTLLDIIKNELTSIYSNPLDYIHGYIRKRGIISNAKEHIGSYVVINMDIKHFFGSISKDKIITTLSRYSSIHTDIAKIIANLVTKDGFLITGFSCSPVLSNMIFLPIDIEIQNYCLGKNIKYTRYGDDMSFSSNKYINGKEHIGIINNIIEKNGFEINNKKTKILGKNRAQYVTGLTVNDGYKPRIPKRIKRAFRLETYYVTKYGATGHWLRSNGKSIFYQGGSYSYDGRARYIFHIEGSTFIKSIKRMIENRGYVGDDFIFSLNF